MERITVFDGEFWAHKNFPPVKDDTVDEFVDCVKELAARLAAYEDTGLEPEEIERILDSYGRGMTLRTENAQRLEIIKEIPINRIRELAQAEKEGRTMVLPCDVKDTVYVIDHGDYEHEYKPYVRLKTVSEINWKATRKKDLGWGLILAGGNCGTKARYKLNNVGKTVFLTREAAEAALDAMRGENNA
jgi:hypothetical protein